MLPHISSVRFQGTNDIDKNCIFFIEGSSKYWVVRYLSHHVILAFCRTLEEEGAPAVPPDADGGSATSSDAVIQPPQVYQLA